MINIKVIIPTVDEIITEAYSEVAKYYTGPFECECGNVFSLTKDEWNDCYIGGEFVPECPKCGKEQVWDNEINTKG